VVAVFKPLVEGVIRNAPALLRGPRKNRQIVGPTCCRSATRRSFSVSQWDR
jgi:hypothetical protein